MKQRYEARCVSGRWLVWDNRQNGPMLGAYGAYGNGDIGSHAAYQMATAMNKGESRD
jgi:hypothetical protein